MTGSPNRKTSAGRQLAGYAGLGVQLAAGLLLMVFLGSKSDKWLGFRIPVFIWLLPLLLVAGMMIKAIKDTSKKQHEDRF